MRQKTVCLALLVLLSTAGRVFGQASTTSTRMVAELIGNIETLAADLSAEQKTNFLLPFDAPARLVFNYLPGERPGLGFKDISETQRSKALDILRAALSAAGFEKEESIRALDDILRETVSAQRYSSGRYFLAVFGEPSTTKPWAMRMEGHHLSLNWTFAAGKVIAVTPQFLGSNPAMVPDGPLKGRRTLAAEEDLGRQLVKSLSAAQSEKAVASGNPASSILARLESKISPRAYEGIPYSALNEEQRGLLLSLIETYLGVQRPEVAAERLKKIRDAGLDSIHFVWIGAIEPGQAHYYRIQGPTFVVEYENSQNNANHIHSGWRDFTDDYGTDPLAEHLARDHRH